MKYRRVEDVGRAGWVDGRGMGWAVRAAFWTLLLLLFLLGLGCAGAPS